MQKWGDVINNSGKKIIKSIRRKYKFIDRQKKKHAATKKLLRCHVKYLKIKPFNWIKLCAILAPYEWKLLSRSFARDKIDPNFSKKNVLNKVKQQLAHTFDATNAWNGANP